MRILFLQKRLLFPADTGGKIRTLNVLRHLAQWHDVTYLSNLLVAERPFVQPMRELGLRLENIPWREPPRRSLRFAASAVINVASRYPLNVAKDYDRRLRARAAELLQQEGYDLLICDFVQMARNAIGLPVRSLLFQHNVEAEIFSRLALRHRGPMAMYLRQQAAKMQAFEGAAGRRFDRVVAVSERDRQRFEQMYGWPHVRTIDTAVDLNFFRPLDGKTRADDQVVFVGSMDWPPNVDGVTHFVRRIWPQVRSQVPTATFTIVGRNPPRSVQDLDHHPGVRVTGTVTDIRPYLARASVGVVPLYSGGGTRLKIFEMMAMRCPVVSTALGAEGLRLQPAEHLLLADDDEAFAKAVIGLLEDPVQRGGLRDRAYQLVQQQYSSEAVARQFEQVCQEAARANCPGQNPACEREGR